MIFSAVVFASVVLVSCSCGGATAVLTPTVPEVDRGDGTKTVTLPESLVVVRGISFAAEVARTGMEQALGLSGRTHLPEKSGMLFPLSRDVVAAFWMRGMLIGLDFVWIGPDCRVADLTENVLPPDDLTQTSGLPIYSPTMPVRYVFEINAGGVRAHGIEVGDRVTFTGLELGNECHG